MRRIGAAMHGDRPRGCARRLRPFGLAVVTLMLAGVASVAGAPHVDDVLDYHIRHNDSLVGRNTVSFRRVGEDLHVDISLDAKVKLAFVTLFRYSHRNHEVWRNGRLVSLESTTDDDGERYFVRARTTDDGLLVEGSNGTYLAPPDLLPASYWNVATIEQKRLLDTRDGKLLDVDVRAEGTDASTALEGETAKRYAVTGDVKVKLWYTPSGKWVRFSFRARGSHVEYALADLASENGRHGAPRAPVRGDASW